MRFPRYEPNTPHPTRNGSGDRGGRSHLHRVSAAIATGKRPAPFRTRKLSPSAPKVLPGRPGGRVGRRRTSFLGGGHPRPAPQPRTPDRTTATQHVCHHHPTPPASSPPRG